MWDEITYPFSNFNFIEVWKRISNLSRDWTALARDPALEIFLVTRACHNRATWSATSPQVLTLLVVNGKRAARRPLTPLGGSGGPYHVTTQFYYIHPTLCSECNYLSTQGLKLNEVTKGTPGEPGKPDTNPDIFRAPHGGGSNHDYHFLWWIACLWTNKDEMFAQKFSKYLSNK